MQTQGLTLYRFRTDPYRSSVAGEVEDNFAFYNGDHWQDGRGWIGPLPEARDYPRERLTALARILRMFVSQNAVKEAVDRHTSGVLGRTPHFGFATTNGGTVPAASTDAERARSIPDTPGSGVGLPEKDASTPTHAATREADLRREAEAMLRLWWNEREVEAELQYALRRSLLGEPCVVRLFMPGGYVMRKVQGVAARRAARESLPGAMSEEGFGGDSIPTDTVEIVPAGGSATGQGTAGTDDDSIPAWFTTDDLTVRDALDLVHVEILPASVAKVELDRFTMERRGEAAVNERQREEVFVDPATEETVFRYGSPRGGKRRKGEPEQAEIELRLTMGRRITLIEVPAMPLVSEQIRQQQKALNKAHTMKNGNLDWSGFPERTFLNAEPLVDEETGKPIPMKFGPHVTNFVKGITQATDPDTGKESVAQPVLQYRSPDPGEIFDKSAEGAYRTILRECHQLHAMLGYGANVSGEAIRQFMADYLVSLVGSASKMNRVGRSVLEAAWAMATAVANGAADADFRIAFACRVYAGPIAPQEADIITKALADGVMSTETALHRHGIEDVPAEMERIRSDPQYITRRAKVLAEAISALQAIGLDPETSAKIAGMDPVSLDIFIEGLKAGVDDMAARTDAEGGAPGVNLPVDEPTIEDVPA